MAKLCALGRRHEDQGTEFKSPDADAADLVRAIDALANSDGDSILLGVGDDVHILLTDFVERNLLELSGRHGRSTAYRLHLFRKRVTEPSMARLWRESARLRRESQLRHPTKIAVSAQIRLVSVLPTNNECAPAKILAAMGVNASYSNTHRDDFQIESRVSK